MPYVKTRDGTDLYVKDWGQGRPVILMHGWPLNADSWDAQAMALATRGSARSPMTGAGSAGRDSPGTAMITTRCRTIWRM